MTGMIDVAEQRPQVLGVIEVMNRSGQVVQRVPWSGSLLRVGRAYDNDLILNDPYVCPHHLELWSDSGRLVARDLNSVNGTYAGDSKERVNRLRLDDGAIIHFGHCQLRYHASGSEVPPTRRDTARHGLLALLGKPALLVLASLLAFVALVVDDLLDTSERLRLLTLAGDLLYPLIGVLAWAGFWSLLNRVVSHRTNFHVHLAISCLGVAGLFFIAQLVSVAGFALGWSDSVPWLKLLGRVGVLWMVIYGHLRYAVQGTARRQAVVAVTAALILFGTPEIGDVIERNEFSTLPYLDPLLRPPAYRLVQGETVEAFFAEARKLRARVDEVADQ
jgi:FHA domain